MTSKLGTTKPHLRFRHGCWWAMYKGSYSSGITAERAMCFLRVPPALNLKYNERRHG